MTHAETIIKRFGGIRAMAKSLGHTNPTTVQGWKLSGNIPKWRKYEIEAAAIRENIELPKEAAQ